MRIVHSFEVIIEIMDVNDCIPRFFDLLQPHFINVSENAAVPTPVLRLQPTDRDKGANGTTHFDIASGNEENYFMIDVPEGETPESTTNRIMFLVRDLNFEDLPNDPVFRLTINISDMGSPPLIFQQHISLTVLNLEDTPPTFETTSYVFNVTENSPVGNHEENMFGQVIAGSDQSSSHIFYSLCQNCVREPQNIGEIVGVDEFTGGLYLKVPIDYEDISLLMFEVAASNPSTRQMQTTSVRVDVINVNEHAPYFACNRNTFDSSADCGGSANVNGLVLFMEENSEISVGRSLQLKVVDNDSTTEFKRIVRPIRDEIEPASSPFGVNKLALGDTIDRITFTLSSPLDREATPTVTFTLMIENEVEPALGSNTTITIHILDINDNAPNFTQTLYEGSVFEGSPVGVEILSVEANDPDLGRNRTVIYSITHVREETARKWFEIDSNTGTISVSSPGIEYLSVVNGTITLIVTASDNGTSPLNTSTTVVIHVLPSATFILGSYQEYSGSEFNLLDESDTSLYFEFRTSELSGLLVYQASEGSEEVLSVEVRDGKVVVQFGNFMTMSDRNVSMDHWHAIHVQRTNQVSDIDVTCALL